MSVVTDWLGELLVHCVKIQPGSEFRIIKIEKGFFYMLF